MKYYEIEYLAQNKRGRMGIKAQNKNDAMTIAKMRSPGIIVKVKESAVPMDERLNDVKDKIEAALGNKKLKIPILVVAIRQLSVMANAGISIHDGVREVTKATTDKKLKLIFEQIDDDLNSGTSLTESLIKFREEVGDITIAMVKLGENTGNMAESLAKLADILQEVWDNQQKFKKAIRYPIIVIVAIAIAFTILMIYVVPKFREIFEQLGAELPLPTKILLGAEYALSNYGLLILAGLLATIFAVKYLYTTSSNFKAKFDARVLKVYLIGNIIFYSTMSRFNLVFSELVKAGLPIADALDTSLLTITNTKLNEQLSTVKISVQRGVSLTDSFRETELYEGMLVQMISAGEQSGSLDDMLLKVTDYYRSKFNDIIDNISSYIEPILIGFIAAMVLLMALGIFMPMWDMAKAVKG